jgi:serine/threonine protein kinase
VKLCDFGFTPPPLLERFTQVIVKLCDFGFAPPPLQERFTQVIVNLCDFGFARATASPGEIYTGNCKAL